MKKISLLLITLLMASPAYSGGDGNSDDGPDAVYEESVVSGAPEALADQPELEQPEAAAAAATARVVPSVDICSGFRLVLQQQWQRVPTVECPCVKRSMRKIRKWGDDAAEELIAFMAQWRDEHRKDAREDDDDQAAEIVRLQKALEEKDALLCAIQAELLQRW